MCMANDSTSYASSTGLFHYLYMHVLPLFSGKYMQCFGVASSGAPCE